MAQKSILIVSINKRRAEAPVAQQILTEYGCIIKTRLGIHDGVLDKCSDHGIIILELVGSAKESRELQRKLRALPGVTVKSVAIPF